MNMFWWVSAADREEEENEFLSGDSTAAVNGEEGWLCEDVPPNGECVREKEEELRRCGGRSN